MEKFTDKFESAFEYAAIGMALVSLTGKWLRVNQSICDITGYTKEELEATDFQSISFKDDLDLDLAHVAQLIGGQIPSYQLEKRYVTKSGEIIWVLLSVSLVYDQNREPQYFISQIQDIHERKLMEERLHLESERLGLALDVAGLGMLDWNLITDVVFFDKKWMALLGYETPPPWKTLSEWAEHDMHPDDRKPSFHAWIEHASEKSPYYEFEFRAKKQSGGYVHIRAHARVVERNASHRPVRAIGVYHEITPAKSEN